MKGRFRKGNKERIPWDGLPERKGLEPVGRGSWKRKGFPRRKEGKGSQKVKEGKDPCDEFLERKGWSPMTWRSWKQFPRRRNRFLGRVRLTRM